MQKIKLGAQSCLHPLKSAAISPFRTVRSLRLSVRTPGFQPGKRGSIPLGSAIRSFPSKTVPIAPLFTAGHVADMVELQDSVCILQAAAFLAIRHVIAISSA